jgi:hypothetical protein
MLPCVGSKDGGSEGLDEKSRLIGRKERLKNVKREGVELTLEVGALTVKISNSFLPLCKGLKDITKFASCGNVS